MLDLIVVGGRELLVEEHDVYMCDAFDDAAALGPKLHVSHGTCCYERGASTAALLYRQEQAKRRRVNRAYRAARQTIRLLAIYVPGGLAPRRLAPRVEDRPPPDLEAEQIQHLGRLAWKCKDGWIEWID